MCEINEREACGMNPAIYYLLLLFLKVLVGAACVFGLKKWGLHKMARCAANGAVLKMRGIRLSDDEFEELKRYGNGKMSDGFRKVWESYRGYMKEHNTNSIIIRKKDSVRAIR